jgi:hypothetical protein
MRIFINEPSFAFREFYAGLDVLDVSPATRKLLVGKHTPHASGHNSPLIAQYADKKLHCLHSASAHCAVNNFDPL